MKKTMGILAILILVLFIFFSDDLTLTPREYPPKIGVLVANDSRLMKVEGLKATLKELGFAEEEVTYHIENARDNLPQLSVLGDQILKGKPDVLVAAGALEALTLKELTAKQGLDIPIVFMGTLSPIEIGLVNDAVRPEKNVTGLNNYHYELTPKRLELLHHLLPEIKKVAILGDTRVPFFEKTPSDLSQTAEELGLELLTYTVSSMEEIQNVFTLMQEARVEGIVLLPGVFLETNTRQIIEFGLQYKLPIFGVYPGDTEEGCLASYGTPNWDQGAQSAHMVSKVLHGQSPQEIPIETPDQIIFSINLKTARALEVSPSQGVLSLADQVVQP